jgi:hypothetical protein
VIWPTTVRLVFLVFAVAAVWAGIHTLRDSIAVVGWFGEGSAGIGAVSAGLSELLVPLLSCVLANRISRGWAMRTGGAVRRLHRTHTFALLTLPALLALSIAVGMAAASLSIVIFLWAVVGLSYAVQYLLIGAVLALLALQRHADSGTL